MSSPHVEQITDDDTLIAVILRRTFRQPGTHFFTPGDLSQQLGYLNLPAGQVIAPHTHAVSPRTVTRTQEVLVLLAGRLRVDFYATKQTYLESRVLEPHDAVLLVAGGHGFEVLTPVEMLEIKLGPYQGPSERVRFTAAPSETIRISGDAE